MRLIFAVLMLASQVVWGQKLNACYKSSDEMFCFADDKSFVWEEGGNSSAGSYDIKKNSIELKFNKPERNFDFQVDESVPNSTTNCRLEIRGIFTNGSPIEGLIVELEKSKRIIKTDPHGAAQLQITDAVAKDILVFRADGIQSPPIPKALRGYDNLISVVLDDTIKYHQNQKVTFSFRKKGDVIFLDDTPFEKTSD